MMESSLAGKPERLGPVQIEDLRKDLLSDFSALPSQDSAQPQSENLQVFLRIRPFTSSESDNGEAQDCVTIEGPDTVILKAPRSIKTLPQTGQKFTFTQVFGPDSSQRAVFDGSVRTLVREVLDGGNCLVFTYGVTNAGKTFTFLGPDHDSGLLPRSLAVIFSSLEGKLSSRCDLKPLRCRDYSRLTPEQQNTESATKRTLLKLFKESDRSLTSGRSTFLDGSNVTDSSLSSDDSFVMDVGSSIRFSVWVSFCEIYNDNIHDLLQHVPNGQQKRTVLRLSQDVKGNSFIKDLRWVQVSSSDEAYRMMKIGKKNQSMSSTRLNQLSSRSHSIFSIRLMKIDDVGVPRVLGISELALCDLAGSERCSRTLTTGERLKEAGNINNSLFTLGKCISAMRNNQHAKFQQHVPFRESKLTHFLQFFFCGSGSGRVSMVVNINQSASCFDETLNVLKFSALAQKVVVLNSRPPPLAAALPRSAMDVSLLIDEAEARRFRGRKSSLLAWETSLEDVQETEDQETEDQETEDWGEEGDEDMEDTELEETVLEAGTEDTTVDQGRQSDREAALRLVLEAQIREEVSAEFMELFNKMEKDYSERLEKEREILEERAEKRVEILKNLFHTTVDMSGLETQRQVSQLNELCQQKDEVIAKLTSTLDQTVEDATRERSVVEAVRTELLQLRQNCSCLRDRGSGHGGSGYGGSGYGGSERGAEEKKRPRDSSDEDSAPAKKRVLLEEEIWRLQEENDLKEQLLSDLRQQREEEVAGLSQEVSRLKEELEHLKEKNSEMETRIQELSEEACPHCDSLLQSLESEQRETGRFAKENKALVNGIFTLQTEVTELKKQLHSQTDRSHSLSEELQSSKTRLHSLQSQSDDREQTIHLLRHQVEKLRHSAQEEDVFHKAMDRLKEESESALKKSEQKSQQIQELQEKILNSERLCVELKEQLSNQEAAFGHVEAELKEQLSDQEAAFGRVEAELKEQLSNQEAAFGHVEAELKEQLSNQEAAFGRVEVELKDQLSNQEAAFGCVEAELKQQLSSKEAAFGRVEAELKEQLSNQEAVFGHVEAELKEQNALSQQRLEMINHQKIQTESKNRELLELVSLREETVAEAHSQMETLRKELELLKEQLQDPEEEKENQQQGALLMPEEQREEQWAEQREEQWVEQREEQRAVTVVEELREEIRKHQQRRNIRTRKRTGADEISPKENVEEDLREDLRGEDLREEDLREQRRMDAVKREVQRFRELQIHNIQRAAGGASPEKTSERRTTPRTTGRKRKSCELKGLVFSENKRNRGRAALLQSSSSVKDKHLTKLGELINKSPSIISSTARGLMGLVVDGRSTGSKRGRRKLYRPHDNSPLSDSPHTGGGGALEDKESDHVTIKRQLRSKSRK